MFRLHAVQIGMLFITPVLTFLFLQLSSKNILECEELQQQELRVRKKADAILVRASYFFGFLGLYFGLFHGFKWQDVGMILLCLFFAIRSMVEFRQSRLG